ncbi:MAG: hypothetical protein H7210_06570, partial [Pyrinomonadaceae bacterium]|nr:hypothetical protein [Phycisphaerales bacterium]
FFPPALWPVKAILRAFSTVPLAIFLLVCVAFYGTLASVPIGIIALAPTFFIYLLTLVFAQMILATFPVVMLVNLMNRSNVPRGARFGIAFLSLLGLTVLSIWLWHHFAWPVMRYNKSDGSGLRLFADFVEKNKAITIRRIPGMEMSELEFYGWWPLKVILITFVANMVITTARRIEFVFPNIGVLTVHTGIVTLALGSMYYSSLKQEGDMLLEAGAVDSQGKPTIGKPESAFYDNTRVALWVSTGNSWQQRPLRGVPRYNDYNLNVLGFPGLDDWAASFDEGRRLGFVVPEPKPRKKANAGDADSGESRNALSDVQFRVVGYAPFAEVGPWWVQASADEIRATNPRQLLPLRNAELLMQSGTVSQVAQRPQFFPTLPAGRVQQLGMGSELEYTRGMTEQRWADLAEPTEAGAMHSMVVDVPARGSVPAFHGVLTLTAGAKFPLGATGYSMDVLQVYPSLLAIPTSAEIKIDFRISTPGYENADTSAAIVKINPPPGRESPYLRLVYHRFPDQNEDVVAHHGGNLSKRKANPEVRTSYINASTSQYYIDEVAESAAPGSSSAPAEPTLRGIFRAKGGQATPIKDLRTGSTIVLGPMASLRLTDRWAHSKPVEYPIPTPENQRDNKKLGTHENAALAVEVSTGEWSKVIWLPYVQYALSQPQYARSIRLPDGMPVLLMFGRYMRMLPNLQLQLADFEMISHDFGGPTQDFRSELLVKKGVGEQQSEEMRHTSLNDPLLVTVPFQNRKDVPGVINAIGRAVSTVIPTQYKFSQAGWDPEGWNESQAKVEQGLLSRPSARWTILGVGNNPGIYIIAVGACMMVLGIPWAFYVKPLIMQRRKKKIQRELAEEAKTRKTDETGATA